jgi:hypothetical protein
LTSRGSPLPAGVARREPGRVVGLLLALLLGACAPKVLDTQAAERARILAEADARWLRRAEPGELDAVIAIWLGQLGQRPDDPVVLARLARAEWTLAWLEGDVRHFENANDFGYRCLLTFPSFGSAAQLDGYRLTEASLQALPPEASACLMWTAAAGIGTVEARGPGAALELASVRMQVERLTALGTTEDPGFLQWSQAMVAVLGAFPEGAPAAARGRFSAAIAAERGVLLFRQAFARSFPDAANVAMDGYAPPTPDPWALENAAWSTP